jgi:hypothetical protein
VNGFVAIGLVIAGLVGVLIIILIFDFSRGDIGGRHTLARARRILVVATDDATAARAEAWIEAERSERPDLQCFLLVEGDGEELYQRVHHALESEAPDTIVMVRHAAERHDAHTGTYARLHDEGVGPIDCIYLEEAVKA